jgi:zinc D-Ala-D-Ala carboxypeptidase
VKLPKFKNGQTLSRRPNLEVIRLSTPGQVTAVPAAQPKIKHQIRWKLLFWLVFIFVLIFIFTSTHTQTGSHQNTPVATFNKTLYSINDPTSIWAIVNKGRDLDSNYVPPDLVNPKVPLRLSPEVSEMHVRKQAATALEQMFAAADQQNIHLMLASGYRSYNEQTDLYSNYAATQGKGYADSSSARPGHSEHQLGLAADLEPASRNCEVDPCFANTPEGQWLSANSYKYGFIIRYTNTQQNLTGYEYEPWHVRFVGAALAGQIHRTGQTLEQFFNLPAYTDYPATSYKLAVGK